MAEQNDRIVAEIDQLKRQLSAYRTEARRSGIGPWIAATAAWLVAGSVSVFTVLALADKTAGVDDGKIGWVVFVAFGSALAATFAAWLND